MGLYSQIPHGVIAVTIQRNKTISEVYTAHVAPAHMEKSEKWFLKRDTKNQIGWSMSARKGKSHGMYQLTLFQVLKKNNIGIASQNLSHYSGQGMDGPGTPGIPQTLVAFCPIIAISKLKERRNDYYRL